MAGIAESLPIAWKMLRKTIEMDDPVSLENNVYLGSAQSDIENDDILIQQKKELYDYIDQTSLELDPDPQEQTEWGEKELEQLLSDAMGNHQRSKKGMTKPGDSKKTHKDFKKENKGIPI